MAFEFKLPDLGEGVHEGEIVRWLVSEGDTVRAEQPLVEVMTDKVTAELPSPVAGRVTRLAAEAGEIVKVGEVLVVIDEGGERRPAAATAEGRPSPEEPTTAPAHDEHPPAVTVPPGEQHLAVPAVRRLAKELGVDLAGVTGTGPEGRIIESDVRAAAGAAPEQPARAARGPRRIPLRGTRRVIAEHLLDAHRNTAPYTYVEEADFTELVSVRRRVQSMAESAGVHLTYLPFIVAAVSMALREHPLLNATVDARTGDLVVHEEQHVGIAIHTDEGLVVPVLRDAQHHNLLGLGREIERLTKAAREGRLSRDEVLGGTFSITSLGPLGGVLGTPMLNTPQVAVLGVHKISPRAVVREGVVTARDMGNLSLTLDHRYIDGYIGAQFAQTLVKYLQDPALMLFWLAELREPPGAGE